MQTRVLYAGCRLQILAILILAFFGIGRSTAAEPSVPPQTNKPEWLFGEISEDSRYLLLARKLSLQVPAVVVYESLRCCPWKSFPALPEKTVKFAMRDKTWREVFEWLAKATGKPVVTSVYPQGKFTFAGPADKEYTIPEVVDIINAALMSNRRTDKYYFINRERSFTIIPPDEKIDMVLLPRIQPEDLGKHGNSELVTMRLPLQSLDADRVAPFLRKLTGPYGEVIPMSHTGINSLILLDTVGNLKKMCGFVMYLDNTDPFPHFAVRRINSRFDPNDPRSLVK